MQISTFSRKLLFWIFEELRLGNTFGRALFRATPSVFGTARVQELILCKHQLPQGNFKIFETLRLG